MRLKLTEEGQKLLLRAMVGDININFRLIQLGNGADAGANAIELSNPLMIVNISGHEIEDTFVTLTAVFNNSEIEAGFCATEIGVVVDDPDNVGRGILYAYEYVPEVNADRIQARTDKILETQLDVIVYIGEAENVTASISQSLVYLPRTEFDAYVARRDNPHNVTKEQVGLGNVENVVSGDQKPAFPSKILLPIESVSKDANTGKTTRIVTVRNIENEETLGIMLQKIMSAIQALTNHLNAENPHNIETDVIDAAEAEHTHATTDIISGILNIARGGTGGNTPLTARRSLGIQSGISGVLVTAGEAVTEYHKFPVAFSEAPKVVITPITPNDNGDICLAVKSTTTEGFTVFTYSKTISTTIRFNWIAVE